MSDEAHESATSSGDLVGRGQLIVYNSEGLVSVGETVSGPLAVPLAGARVVQCQLDHAFSLVLDEDQPGRHWTVRIEAPFSLSRSGGPSRRFGDDAPPSAWAPAVDALLHGEIDDAEATADGTLMVRLRDGSELEAPPIAQYEAWQINGPEGIFAVCGPGRQLSRWRPATDADR
jgi:hypothetical protein